MHKYVAVARMYETNKRYKEITCENEKSRREGGGGAGWMCTLNGSYCEKKKSGSQGGGGSGWMSMKMKIRKFKKKKFRGGGGEWVGG